MDWRTDILKAFTPGVARKTVVSDSDGLLREEHLFRRLIDRGFSVLHFDDPVAFRFTYEAEFRQNWNAGGSKELVIVLGPGVEEFNNLPADVLADARRLAFYLQDVFPNLSYSVVSQLDRNYLDQLFAAHQQYAQQPLGDALTRDFILRHVFEIAPEVIKRDSDLLRVLLQRHYRRLNIPDQLNDYLISVLKSSERFPEWPLKEIVSDREAFWEFLQERWPLFVADCSSGAAENAATGEVAAELRFPKPLALPFEHDDVRVYIDNLFAEGILKPINWVAEAVREMPWIKVGMVGGPENRAEVCFGELLKGVKEGRPHESAAVQDWLSFAVKYARLKALRTREPQSLTADDRDHCDTFSIELNAAFAAWVHKGYASQFNYPPLAPVMVHHIPGFLAHRMDSGSAGKVAFLLVDGLSLSQWHVLTDAIAPALKNLSFHEQALLAWIPTTTPVSRQAAFAGKIPSYFADTIQRTDKDEDGWRRFWSDRGLAPDEVGFTAVHGNDSDMAKVDGAINHSTRALGITIYKVDKIMHGIELGEVGMAGQVATWGTESFFSNLLRELVDRGFEIWLSADHGNIESTGIGAPKEGVLSETMGERCRVYSSPVLRKKAAEKFPDAKIWDHPALPSNFCCLLAPDRHAFTQEGHAVVCHGGISIDEVIVPFVQIARKGEKYK